MSASPHPNRPTRQGGLAAVEFALVSVVFFMFVFGSIELSRLLYLWNTMTEITNRAARAAAVTDFKNTTALAQARQKAMFLNSAGKLVLGGGIDASYLKIDYLASDATTVISPLPACAPINLANCTDDPNGASCIRFVRVRLCQPNANDCDKVPYAPMVSLIGLDSFATIHMPTFAAVAPAETLGMPAACP